MMLRPCVLLALLTVGELYVCTPAHAQFELDEVEVEGRRAPEVIEPQRLEGRALERLSSRPLADALRYFAGLQVKDYGGLGGLKTVNLRSMGSQHVGVTYDGLQLGGALNGQVDLGQLSLDNVEAVAVSHGERSPMASTAMDYALGGTVSLRTRVPRFAEGERQHVRLRARGGSAGLAQVAGLVERRLAGPLTLSVGGEALSASGQYHFRYRRRAPDGSWAYDTTAVRHNGDVQSLRAEANLHGALERGHWSAKGYTYHSARGIPGAIVGNVWRRGERQADDVTFVQGQWQRALTDRWSARALAKWATYRTHYQNRDTTQQLVDNRYHQQEAIASTTHEFAPTPAWTLSASYDCRWNLLTSDVVMQSTAHRWTHVLALAAGLRTERLRAQASLTALAVADRGGTPRRTAPGSVTADGPTWRRLLSPALFVQWMPWGEGRLAVRGFAKRSLRLPTFSDLYYTEVGNSQLRPEAAVQYDLGLAWRGLTADVYHNAVHDKIVAYPKGQQFRWTMLNLGRVHIDGLDVAAEREGRPLAGFSGPWAELSVRLRAQYTWQRAVDVTDRASTHYGDQIPYVPRHSGSAIVGLVWRSWDVDYSFIYTGERWSQPENIGLNHLQPWYTSDLALQYRHGPGFVHQRHGTSAGSRRGIQAWRLMLEVNNLLAQDYDVIVNYPMPRRSYAVSLHVEL